MPAKPKTASSEVEKPFPNPSAPPDEKATRIVIQSVLQAELNLAKEDLKKANEKLVLLEKEKEKAHKLSKQANEKLKEAEEESFEVAMKFEFLKSDLEIIKQEKSKLADELEASRNEDKKSNKVSENLASALHEVLYQAKVAKEALSSIQAGNENYKMLIEDLKSVMVAKDEKYESVINALTNSIERSKHGHRDLKADMENKELHLTNTLKRSEEEKSCMEFEISRLANLLKKLEKEAESAKIRVCLIDKENELQKNVSENDELRKREMALLVQEALAKNNKQEEENGEIMDSSEKDYDLLPKWPSFMQINEEHAEVSEGDIEMWESFKVDDYEKDSYLENEANGVMKKKKPLLGKIGNLLKKGSSSD